MYQALKYVLPSWYVLVCKSKCIAELRDSGNQTDSNEGSWQLPFFEASHTSCGICVLQAPGAKMLLFTI